MSLSTVPAALKRKPKHLSSGSNGASASKRRRPAAAAVPEERSRQILAAMLAFRDGDFSVRLPADWAGIDGRIAEAFNQTIAHDERASRARSAG